jgi:hypothetical protein
MNELIIIGYKENLGLPRNNLMNMLVALFTIEHPRIWNDCLATYTCSVPISIRI